MMLNVDMRLCNKYSHKGRLVIQEDQRVIITNGATSVDASQLEKSAHIWSGWDSYISAQGLDRQRATEGRCRSTSGGIGYTEE